MCLFVCMCLFMYVCVYKEGDVATSITLEELVELVQAPRDLTPSKENIQIRKVPNFFKQFVYFFMRDCVRIYRESAGVLANCFLQALYDFLCFCVSAWMHYFSFNFVFFAFLCKRSCVSF